LEDPAELPLAEGRWHVGHAHEAILAVLRHRVPPRDALLPAGTSAKTPVHVVVGAEVLIVRSRSADAAGAADVTTARPDAGAVLLVARRPCRFLPRGFLLVRRRRPPGFPSSKTSELCNRLILLDHNKIKLMLNFYTLQPANYWKNKKNSYNFFMD
jgi:hypothetical protein